MGTNHTAEWGKQAHARHRRHLPITEGVLTVPARGAQRKEPAPLRFERGDWSCVPADGSQGEVGAAMYGELERNGTVATMLEVKGGPKSSAAVLRAELAAVL